MVDKVRRPGARGSSVLILVFAVAIGPVNLSCFALERASGSGCSGRCPPSRSPPRRPFGRRARSRRAGSGACALEGITLLDETRAPGHDSAGTRSTAGHARRRPALPLRHRGDEPRRGRTTGTLESHPRLDDRPALRARLASAAVPAHFRVRRSEARRERLALSTRGRTARSRRSTASARHSRRTGSPTATGASHRGARPMAARQPRLGLEDSAARIAQDDPAPSASLFQADWIGSAASIMPRPGSQPRAGELPRRSSTARRSSEPGLSRAPDGRGTAARWSTDSSRSRGDED